MAKPNYTGFRLKDAIATNACIATLIILLGACGNPEAQSPAQPDPTPQSDDPAGGYSLDSVLDSLGSGLRGVSSNMGPQAEALHSRTKEEFEKLFRWEYRVVDLPGSLPAAEFEGKLGELGMDGWECFSMTPKGGDVRVSCKRHPPSAMSYLKYDPGL